MPDHFEKSVLKELADIKRLLARLMVAPLSPRDQVSTLSKMKFQPAEIAKVLGKSGEAVRQLKFKAKTSKHSKSKQASNGSPRDEPPKDANADG